VANGSKDGPKALFAVDPTNGVQSLLVQVGMPGGLLVEP
jgi:hypothetical protein